MKDGTSLTSARPSERGMVDGMSGPERADTPCIAVCSTTFDDFCRGCGRSVLEVAHWVSMTDLQKEVVWQRITAQGYPRRNT